MPDGFDHAGPLTIGLLNNMRSAQGESAERQFRRLLASSGQAIRVVSADGPALLDFRQLDALIVTGVQPQATTLREEPCWTMLTDLADRVLGEGVPTLWSCLSAQAAVLHRHGVARKKLPRKLAEVAECRRLETDCEEHPLLAGLPARWTTPHSRYNELRMDELRQTGCRVLSWSPSAGADVIVDAAPALQIYLQGHPEYGPETLLKEYARDVALFLGSERETLPPLPAGYLSSEAADRLGQFHERAEKQRDAAVMDSFPYEACAAGLDGPWLTVAGQFCGNWLNVVRATRVRSAVKA